MWVVAKLDALEERLRVFYREKGPVRPLFTICLLLAGASGLLLPSFLSLSVPVRWDIGTKVIGGLLVCAGLWLTWRRIRVSDKQVQAIEDGQVTERFTKAIEQLGASRDGEPNLEVRLGGIFALERIARDSERDHWTVMEVLSAYVRENARLELGNVYGEAEAQDWDWDENIDGPIWYKDDWGEAEAQDWGEAEAQDWAKSKEPSLEPPRVDVQAALTVIVRREVRKEPSRIDLAKTSLQQAHLLGAHLQLVDFTRADLRGAQLQHANLTGAILWEADLRVIILWGAKLQGANLERAAMRGAILQKTDLSVREDGNATNLHEADLRGARLEGADLTGANLQGANLTGANLFAANLCDANLAGADLQKAELAFANFKGADLANAFIDEDTLFQAEGLSRDQLKKANILMTQANQKTNHEGSSPSSS